MHIISIKSTMEEYCIVCYENYEPYFRSPMVLCSNLHTACYQCSFVKTNKLKCPQCNEEYPIDKRILFQPYNQCDKQLRVYQRKKAKELANLESYFGQITSNILLFTLDQAKVHYSQLRLQAKAHMKEGRYLLAAYILKSTAQTYMKIAETEQYRGLGSIYELSYTKLKGCYNYWIRYGRHLSLFDEIAICFNEIDRYEETVSWYAKMNKLFPNNFQLLFGWGIFELNYRQYQRSIEIFFKSIRLRHSFTRAYAMLALAYQRLGQLITSENYAKLVLSRDSKNLIVRNLLLKFDYYIDIDCKKYKKEQLQRPSTSVLSMLIKADFYQNIKIFDKSIELYRKCLEVWPFNTELSFKIGYCLTSLENYKKALQYLDVQKAQSSKKAKDIIDVLQTRTYCLSKLHQQFDAMLLFQDRLIRFSRPFKKQCAFLAYLDSCFANKRYKDIIKDGLNHDLNQYNHQNYASSNGQRHIYNLIGISYLMLGKMNASVFWADLSSEIVQDEAATRAKYQLTSNLYLQLLCLYSKLNYVGVQRLNCLKRSAEILEKLDLNTVAITYLKECQMLTHEKLEKDQLRTQIRRIQMKVKTLQPRA